MTNAQIAQLNDLAYRAVRQKGMQKKLDERAIKNEAYYKKLEQQVKGQVAKMNFPELRTKHKDLIDRVGACPMSCFDIIEAMEAGDCMCLCLDVGRSPAAIADPTKLVIKDIVPMFMASDSFLDSAIFNIGKNKTEPEAIHGGFKVGNQGKIAIGLGRENITGVLPLYLFPEHWEFARRKAAPVYGFLCTLDIMGYASSQYFTIPYLVLLRAISKVKEEKGTEMYKNVLHLVTETCINIMKGSEEFRKNTIEMIKKFVDSAEFRTIDAVPSIQVMLAQIYCLMQIEGYEQYLVDGLTLNMDTLQLILRYSVEEMLRRSLKADMEPLGKSQILKLLYPEYEFIVKFIMDTREKELRAEVSSGESMQGNAYGQYESQAKIFKSKDKGMHGSQLILEEENKQMSGGSSGNQKNSKKLNIDEKVDEIVNKQVWRSLFNLESSEVNKLMSGAVRAFAKRNVDTLSLASMLELLPDDSTDFTQIQLINGDKVILLAMLVQNAIHPKNHQRREAVTGKTYKEIKTSQDGVDFISALLKMHLRNELASKET